MAKANNTRKNVSETSAKEVKNPERAKAMSKYIKDKKEAVKSGQFEILTMHDEKIKVSEIKHDDNNMPIVFDENNEIIYKNVPIEMFGSSKLGKSLRFKYLAKVEELRIKPLLEKIEQIKAKADQFVAKSEEVLREPTEEEIKEAKRAKLLAQLAELEA